MNNQLRNWVAAVLMGSVVLGLAFSPNADANCCNIVTTQSCAECNIFMCHCKHSCDCEVPCKERCSQEQNACIADCTQTNCDYCNSYFHACERRCDQQTLDAERIADLESEDQPYCEIIFAAFDADGDGLISQQEFVTAFDERSRVLGEDSRPESPVDIAVMLAGDDDPADLFRSLDANGDGFIDRSEAGTDQPASR